MIEDVRTDHFQQLLENQLPEMQRYPQKINEQLDRVVEQSREHLESVKLETATMVAGHELERSAKQPEIELQLEKPVEERPIVDERQQDARQEDLNPTLAQDDRELTRQEKLELIQEKIDEIREIYVNRIHEVNQELSDINQTRQVEGYWEQPQEIIQADNDRAELLLSQRLNLYEILDRTPDDQQAYLDQHPEFDQVLNERDYDKVQTTLDDLSETMPKAIKLEDNPDDYKVGVWDSVTESIGDTARTVDAFVEVAVADALNTGTKIGMNVGAVTLGAYHGIKEGSLDDGITAMREIRDGAVDGYKVEASQSSQEILANSENLQAVGRAIHDGVEYGYDKIGEHLGDEAQFLARGAVEAVGDTLAVTGAELGARSIAKNLDYTVVNFKYAQLETSPNIAHHIRNLDGYDPKNGIKGAHNRENFTQGLNDNNLQITKEVQGSKGISEVYYVREKVNGRGEPDGFKNFREPKTIYDPKIYSDEQILQMGKKAVVMGYDDALQNFLSNPKNNRIYHGTVSDVRFTIYFDEAGKISNFHPSMTKGKH